MAKEKILFNSADYICEDPDEWDVVHDAMKTELDYVLDVIGEVEGEATITGTLGLWNGKKEIIPEKETDLETAIKRCIGDNTEELKISDVDGKLIVECSHHDGTNVFDIRLAHNKKPRIGMMFL